MKRIMFLFVLLIFVAGCGGGSGDSDVQVNVDDMEPEVIEPMEPEEMPEVPEEAPMEVMDIEDALHCDVITNPGPVDIDVELSDGTNPSEFTPTNPSEFITSPSGSIRFEDDSWTCDHDVNNNLFHGSVFSHFFFTPTKIREGIITHIREGDLYNRCLGWEAGMLLSADRMPHDEEGRWEVRGNRIYIRTNSFPGIMRSYEFELSEERESILGGLARDLDLTSLELILSDGSVIVASNLNPPVKTDIDCLRTYDN